MDYAKVAQHNSAQSCWVVLYGRVYDVTSFLPHHPGGSKIILQLAGCDATSEYDPVHPPGTLEESLPASCNLGEVDPSTLPAAAADDSKSDKDEAAADGPPDLESLLNLDDFEAAARPLLSRKAWAYYSSASDDGYSKHLNNAVFRSILFRPRIFVDCTRCDTSTRLLTHLKKPLSLGMPVFVAPAAMARLAHPDGEAAIARACATFGAAHVISNNASMTPEQIVAGAHPDQVFGWQLYVQTQRQKSEAMLARIARLPQIKFIVLTLDAPVPGKREDDERTKHESGGPTARAAVQGDADGSAQQAGGAAGAGLGKALFAGTAPDLTWATTLPWLSQHTQLPIVLKGVQTHEDAWLAARHAPQVQAMVLSNHGGRALDGSSPAVHTLLEMHRYCPHVFARVDVLIDGGMRRGTDVAKALCLGARAVGIGRAALHGLAVGGQAGVERVLGILKQELETAMRLLGCEHVQQLGRRHVNTRTVERDIYDGPADLEGPGLWQRPKL